MRPYVDKCQDLPARVDGYAPITNSAIVIGAQVMKWMQRWRFAVPALHRRHSIEQAGVHRVVIRVGDVDGVVPPDGDATCTGA